MTYPMISEYIDALRLSGDNLDRLRHLKPVWRNGRPVMSSGNFAVVFKMTDGERDYVIKCFIKEQEGRREAYRKIAAALKRVRSEYLIGVDYLERELYVGMRKDGENEFPVLLMDWVEGVPLDAYLRAASKEEKVAVAGRFEGMVRWLLHQPIAHGDLKPDNILVRKDGTIVLLDYDGMYVPSMAGERPREMGTKPYCHPTRTAGTFDSHIDDHAAVLMTLLLRVIAGHPELDYDGLLKSAGKPELISQLQGHMADEGVAAALSAYLLVLSCGRMDAILLDMILSFGEDMAVSRRLAGDALKETPNDVVPAEASNAINGHEYVDLGLSVMWATCNVGANSPEEYGDYFAWGETKTKEEYTEENCETWEEDIGDIGGTSRDVAHVKWGSPWRMPTDTEIIELIENCDWEWTTLNGVNGYRVTGRNGNSIFLPAAGWRDETSLSNAGEDGDYWSSTPLGSDTQDVCDLNFYNDVCDYWSYCNLRYCGQSVRPVIEKKEFAQGEKGTYANLANRGKSMGRINDHEYVDLGLSVRWATCNIGANSPEEYGDYYAWGETETKEEYTKENCETYNKNIGDIKGTSRDVAHVKWGSPWRMPTLAESQELLKNCHWEWTTLNGVNGYRVTGKNGNSIFLPASVWCDDDVTLLFNAGEFGHYWSSTPLGSGSQLAYYLHFSSGSHDWSWYYRSFGQSVRPVSEF